MPAPGLPVDPAWADGLERDLDCTGLAAHLKASAHLFGAGWEFAQVVWGKRGRGAPYRLVPSDTTVWEFLAMEVGNKWNDLALYRRRLAPGSWSRARAAGSPSSSGRASSKSPRDDPAALACQHAGAAAAAVAPQADPRPADSEPGRRNRRAQRRRRPDPANPFSVLASDDDDDSSSSSSLGSQSETAARPQADSAK